MAHVIQVAEEAAKVHANPEDKKAINTRYAGHGKVWRDLADQAQRAFGNYFLITPQHRTMVNFPYKLVCTACRHSQKKLLRIAAPRCSHCKSREVEWVPIPRINFPVTHHVD